MAGPVCILAVFSGGVAPVAGRCRAEVATRWSGHQCKNKAGLGIDGKLCHVHARQADLFGYTEVK